MAINLPLEGNFRDLEKFHGFKWGKVEVMYRNLPNLRKADKFLAGLSEQVSSAKD
jgi:hypothetical protein